MSERIDLGERRAYLFSPWVEWHSYCFGRYDEILHKEEVRKRRTLFHGVLETLLKRTVKMRLRRLLAESSTNLVT